MTLNADGSFTYTPTAGFSGTDTFTYEASNVAGTDTATVTITVQPPPNQPPVAAADTFTTLQDTPLTITAAAVLADDSDPDGDPLRFASPLPLTNPQHGTITGSGGAAVYTPDAGFSGIDTFTYAISDGTDNSAAATIRIAVTPATPPDPGGGGGGGGDGGGGGGGGAEVIVNPDGGGTVLLPDVDPVIEVCRVRVDITRRRDRVAYRTVLATGRVRIRDGENVKVKLKPRRDALRRTSNRVGPLPIAVRVICRTGNGEVLGQAERRFALRTVTTPGSWVPDHATLTATGKRFVSRLARRLRALDMTRIRCDGHTANVPADRVNTRALSRRRAELVCRELRQRSLVAKPSIVPHAGRDPIATNATEAGRAANRRVAVTVLYDRNARSNRAVSGLLRLVASRHVAPSRQRAAPRRA